MSLDVIARIVEELGGRVSIWPEADPFRPRVMEHAAGELDELYEDLEEAEFDVEVRIEWDADPAQMTLTVRAASSAFETTLRLYARQLNGRERSAVLRELVSQKRKHEARRETVTPKVLVRKRSDNSYDLHIAAQKLDVPAEWLKKTVPCTGYRCSPGEEEKTAHEFRYRKDVVDRLCKVKENAFDAADLAFVADLCCEGDLEWARDIVAALQSRRSALRE